jgi:hypothetical protein
LLSAVCLVILCAHILASTFVPGLACKLCRHFLVPIEWDEAHKVLEGMQSKAGEDR